MGEHVQSGDPDEILAIVTGANGALGKAYLEQFATLPNVRSVGITRERKNEIPGVEYRHGVDLLEAHTVREAIYSLGCEYARRILLIHPVGKFKFEETPPQEIDPEVLLSNMDTMVNSVQTIMHRLREATLTVCCFGSVSDKYDVPFWRSYTSAKNEVRSSLRTLSSLFPGKATSRKVRSIMVNVSTTATGNENLLRPNADTSYWLQPKKIVEQSLPLLMAETGGGYQEIDVIEEKPGFDPAEYYGNPDRILEKWTREMKKPLSS